MKVCSKCKVEKSLDSFANTKGNKDFKRGICKNCDSLYYQDWKLKNPNKKKEIAAKWREKYPNKVKEYNKKYAENNPEKVKERFILLREWSKNNIDKVREKNRKYAAANRYKNTEWVRNNPIKNKEIHQAYEKRIKEELLTPYIKQKAKQQGFTNLQLSKYPEILETIKILIKTKRLCKTSQN